jgi:hypothetical protein
VGCEHTTSWQRLDQQVIEADLAELIDRRLASSTGNGEA